MYSICITHVHTYVQKPGYRNLDMTFFVVIFGSQLLCSLIAIIAIIYGMYLIILYHFRLRRVPADHHHRNEVEGLKSGCLYYYYIVIIILIATTSKINIKRASPDDSLYLFDVFNHTVGFFSTSNTSINPFYVCIIFKFSMYLPTF